MGVGDAVVAPRDAVGREQGLHERHASGKLTN
jgi:hypothetical protein